MTRTQKLQVIRTRFGVTEGRTPVLWNGSLYRVTEVQIAGWDGRSRPALVGQKITSGSLEAMPGPTYLGTDWT